MWLIFPLIFLSGFIDSIAGGGGLISLTAYLAVGMPAHLALGTNKFSAVIGTAISTVRFAKAGHVRWDSAVFAFIGALVGSACGAQAALLVDEQLLRMMMVVIVPTVALIFLLKRDFGILEKNLPRTKVILYSVIVGFILGGYDGFFGPGTGTFLIMAFTSVLGFGLLTACGNTKVVNLSSNLAALVIFVLQGSVNYRLGIPCAICGILGNYIGTGVAMKKGANIVRPMMFVVVGLLVIKIIYDLLQGS